MHKYLVTDKNDLTYAYYTTNTLKELVELADSIPLEECENLLVTFSKSKEQFPLINYRSATADVKE